MKTPWWWKEQHGRMPAVADSFRRALVGFDPALAIRWDILQDRYIIVERRKDRDHYVLTVTDDTGRFLPCDQRVIRRLIAIDGSRFGHGRPADYLRHVDSEQQARLAKQDRDDEDDLHHMVRADRRFIEGAAVVTVPGARDDVRQ